MGGLGTAGKFIGCTLMLAGKVIDSTMAAGESSAVLAGGVSKETAMTAES